MAALKVGVVFGPNFSVGQESTNIPVVNLTKNKSFRQLSTPPDPFRWKLYCGFNPQTYETRLGYARVHTLGTLAA